MGAELEDFRAHMTRALHQHLDQAVEVADDLWQSASAGPAAATPPAAEFPLYSTGIQREVAATVASRPSKRRRSASASSASSSSDDNDDMLRQAAVSPEFVLQGSALPRPASIETEATQEQKERKEKKKKEKKEKKKEKKEKKKKKTKETDDSGD